MKLRSPVRLPQHLFVCLLLVAGLPALCRAQQDASVIFKATPAQAVAVKVMGVEGASLMVKDQFGVRGLPLVQILEVRMTAPPEVNTALQAFQAKDYAKALSEAKAVADKYKGLPANWASSMAALVGDIYLAQGDLVKAATAYDDFSRAYPGNPGANLGRARIAIAKKDYATAAATAEPLCQKAMQEKNPTQAESQVYGQAFLVLGQLKEAQNDYPAALEDYLRTVTLFYHDRTATAVAQERADALRKSHPIFVP